MKLKFKKQQYQDDAVMSVVNCFIGQNKGNRKDLIARYQKQKFLSNEMEDIEVIAFGNKPIELSDSERRFNIKEVQRINDISYTDKENLNDFTIEMETGTGKTFTYIKTMYELNNNYGWSKFIVVVPSIAIREGVQKSFEITGDYFQEQYKRKIRFFVYNSANSSNIANINSFASDDSIQVMIINYQAFNANEEERNKKKNRIFEKLDELQSRRPIDVINSVRPILIIDEPQKIGDATEKKLEKFKPLFKIRYSATHKKGKEYNKIYRLDAIDAYNQKLVKKINVKGIEVLNNNSEDTYMFLESVDISEKHDPIARMEIEVKSGAGVTRRLMKIRAGDDLYTKSGGLTPYKGYVVAEIDARHEQYDKVVFTNGKEISSGQATGDVDEEYIVRIQIRETIRTHLEKERNLFKQGIKVLSLFFINEVAKYKYYENGIALKGDYAKVFEEEYINAINDFRSVIDEEYTKYLDSFDTGKIHSGYFSIDKKGQVIDSTINDKKEYLSFDEGAYDLIMKDKERLLSLNEQVRFIFSHSALREGWDNPNIFQICTLKHSDSEISKRQEIGRGLRICVNNEGDRMDYNYLENDFHAINTLTVVASESYDNFAKSLQDEMAESLTARPKNFVQENFIGKVLINEKGDKYEFTSEHYQDLLIHNVINGYVDKADNYKITDKFITAIENNNLDIMPELQPFKNEVYALMVKLYSSKNDKLLNNDRKNDVKGLRPNDNFNKKEFQELWNKINVKTIYEVSFDSEELIKNAVKAINENLNIDKMKVRITQGSQIEKISAVSINSGESLRETSEQYEIVNDFSSSQIRYDLVGELTKDTGLTRKTIIEILKNIRIDKFETFKYNPENFLRKVAKIINEEKASTVIDGIMYHKTEQKYSNDIFINNSITGELGKNAIDVKKHIYDYLISDSNIEREFAKKLEVGEVTVYAKLPNGFKIPTPVGNYNPDWAIAFNKKDIKYVYFIAETKGSTSDVELRKNEKSKIEFAKKHFEAIFNGKDKIKYGVVDSYETLMDML